MDVKPAEPKDNINQKPQPQMRDNRRDNFHGGQSYGRNDYGYSNQYGGDNRGRDNRNYDNRRGQSNFGGYNQKQYDRYQEPPSDNYYANYRAPVEPPVATIAPYAPPVQTSNYNASYYPDYRQGMQTQSTVGASSQLSMPMNTSNVSYSQDPYYQQHSTMQSVQPTAKRTEYTSDQLYQTSSSGYTMPQKDTRYISSGSYSNPAAGSYSSATTTSYGSSNPTGYVGSSTAGYGSSNTSTYGQSNYQQYQKPSQHLQGPSRDYPSSKNRKKPY